MAFGSFWRTAFVCALVFALPLSACGKSVGRGGGDAGEDSGSGGSAGEPGTSNAFVSQLRQTSVDKVDLLFMIDNSISMADKQALLAQAVPNLLERLIQPVCVNEQGDSVARNTNGMCPTGYAQEFNPVNNIHIGVITSSLGHHGSHDVCSDATENRTPDDKARLLPSVRPNIGGLLPLTSWNEQGFLVWDPRGNGPIDAHVPPGWGSPGGPGDARDLVAAFQSQLAAAGELGCGYEQQLESWYRFLVDPEPVLEMDNNGTYSVRVKDGSGTTVVDQLLLDQRAAFLRHDSLLAIIMLTDENDCSILDEDNSMGWLVGFKGGVQVNNWRMPSSTASCKADPNSACCRPCVIPPGPGCPDDAAEGCPAGGYLTIAEDSMNQRCFRQLQRFGLDMLYPTSRYAEAITSTLIDPRLAGALVPNPLFASGPNGEPAREPGLVLLAGIVGVPWQDIATDGNVPVDAGKLQPPNSLASGRDLVYLNAQQLSSMNRWPVILGEPSSNIPPADPLMIESIDPRPTGAPHPLNYPGAAIAVPGSNANTINGAEQAVDPATRDDLQFACIFDLPEPVPCNQTNSAGCNCTAADEIKNSPLCRYPTPGADGEQIKAKAYPSLRELEVLHEIGDAAIVASICPKNPGPQGNDPSADPNFGYNPAVAAIVDRLKRELTAKCLPRPLSVNDEGATPCKVIIAAPPDGLPCACDSSRGRTEAELSTALAVREAFHNQGGCGVPPTPDCSDFCLCELEQFEGAENIECRTEASLPDRYGFCYIDPAATRSALEADGLTSAEAAIIEGESTLVATCRDQEKRVLRFLGEDTPPKGAPTFLVCSGATLP